MLVALLASPAIAISVLSLSFALERTHTTLSAVQVAQCGRDDTTTLRLSRSAEGLALIRMRGDLDAASRIESVRVMRGAANQQQGIELLRRDLDSLVQVAYTIVGDGQNTRTRVRQDEQRLAVNVRVRALANQVDSLVFVTAARARGLESSAPEGYLGVTLSSVPVRLSIGAGYVVSYCEPPVVEAVDPGSPADRAGLLAGDTLLAFNGSDVLTGTVDYPALLVPGRSLLVRVKRGTRRVEVPVRVAVRPEAAQEVRYYKSAPIALGTRLSPEGFWPMPMERMDSVRGLVSRFDRGQQSGVSVSITRSFPSEGFAFFSDSGAFVRGTTIAAAPAAPRSGFMSEREFLIAGARLQSLGAELRAALDLPEGVLVLQVPQNSPAFEIGLREGDVIQRANGERVRSVDAIRLAVDRAASARVIVFELTRKDGAVRQVTLRW